MQLAELQQAVLAAVLDGDERIADELQGGRGGLEIQRASVQGIQQRALGEIYPVLARLLGKPSFAVLTREYLREHPARSPDLHELGADLAIYVQEQTWLVDWPYLADVARLEWCWHRVFHEAEDRPCNWRRLQALEPDQQAACRLHLPQASRLLASNFPIADIWHANQSLAEPCHVDLDQAAGQSVLVLRRGASWPCLESLAAEDFARLRRIAAGASLSELNGDPDAAQALPRFVEAGWVCGFSLGPEAGSPAR